MKRSTVIIIVLSFALGLTVLALGFILLTSNNISEGLFKKDTSTTTTAPTTTKPTTTTQPRTEYDPMDFTGVDLSQYITLGEYKDVVAELEIEESDYKSYEDYVKKEENLEMLLIGHGVYEKITTGVLEAEAIFSFDYSGKLNGVAFEGGTAQNTFAYIKDGKLNIVGGSQFIDGFAENMLGAEVGKEFDIDIKFPDNYSNTDLAGKDTVFTVKINHVVGEIDFTDEWINRVSEGKYPTTKDYIDFCVEFMIEYQNSGFVVNSIIEKATVVSIPQAEFDYYYYDLRYYIEDYAAYYGMTYEAFLSSGYASLMGIASATSDDELRTYVENIVKMELVLLAVSEAENIEVTDEEYEQYIEDMMSENNVTREEIFKYYTEASLRKDVLLGKASDFLNENNEFAVKIVPDTEETPAQ